jgi:hypothetical protein
MSACPDNYRDVEGYFELPVGFDKLSKGVLWTP